MSEQDNLCKYSDPKLYDAENCDFEPDGPFILSLAKELGGTGRLTIPLTENNVDIVWHDVVPGMVDLAKENASELPIEWAMEDIRKFQLGRKFKLIFESGSVFHHMLTRQDQEAYLARVREHLEEDGQLVLRIFFPKSHNLVSRDEEEDWFKAERPESYVITVSGFDMYDAFRQIMTETAYRSWMDASGKEMTQVAPLSLRYVSFRRRWQPCSAISSSSMAILTNAL